jgi:hypothetical protein
MLPSRNANAPPTVQQTHQLTMKAKKHDLSMEGQGIQTHSMNNGTLEIHAKKSISLMLYHLPHLHYIDRLVERNEALPFWSRPEIMCTL